MNMEMICSLFSLFSGEENPYQYQPLLMAAVHEVTAGLRSQSDAGEVRLCYLAAAVANLRYTQMFGAREKALATYAGTMARQSDASHQLRFAEQLVSSYRALCCDLLEEKSFFFSGVKG